jgi:hypothetical protein
LAGIFYMKREIKGTHPREQIEQSEEMAEIRGGAHMEDSSSQLSLTQLRG